MSNDTILFWFFRFHWRVSRHCRVSLVPRSSRFTRHMEPLSGCLRLIHGWWKSLDSFCFVFEICFIGKTCNHLVFYLTFIFIFLYFQLQSTRSSWVFVQGTASRALVACYTWSQWRFWLWLNILIRQCCASSTSCQTPHFHVHVSEDIFLVPCLSIFHILFMS